MKSIALLLFLLGTFPPLVWAHKTVDCQVLGHQASRSIALLRLETLSDIFSLTNAKTMTLEIDGEELRFFRTSLRSMIRTNMVFIERKKWQIVKTAFVQVDRSPRRALQEREFYGKLKVIEEQENEVRFIQTSKDFLDLDFYCRF